MICHLAYIIGVKEMLDGIIILNKQKGCTSHDVVAKTKRLLKEKVGHTGTLDPNATGVLPLLVGQGTKLSAYLIEHDKEYIATLKLGEKRDTADSEGAIIEKRQIDYNVLQKEKVEQVLKSFIGKQEQIPPMYSAIKIDGKKLYEYARKNESVKLKPRNIEIYQMDLIDIIKDTIVFKVQCSKGTYIRSLCEDIAEKLDTVGYMKELKRTKVGKFDINDSITTEELEQNIENSEFINEHFITIENYFEDKQSIQLNERKLSLFLNGVKLTYDLTDDMYKIYDNNNKFVGIGSVKNNLLKREIIVEN